MLGPGGGRDPESKQAKEIEVNVELITLSFSPGFYDLSFWGQPFPEAAERAQHGGVKWRRAGMAMNGASFNQVQPRQWWLGFQSSASGCSPEL